LSENQVIWSQKTIHWIDFWIKKSSYFAYFSQKSKNIFELGNKNALYLQDDLWNFIIFLTFINCALFCIKNRRSIDFFRSKKSIFLHKHGFCLNTEVEKCALMDELLPSRWWVLFFRSQTHVGRFPLFLDASLFYVPNGQRFNKQFSQSRGEAIGLMSCGSFWCDTGVSELRLASPGSLGFKMIACCALVSLYLYPALR